MNHIVKLTKRTVLGQVAQSDIQHRIAAMHQVSIILIAARADIHWATGQNASQKELLLS